MKAIAALLLTVVCISCTRRENMKMEKGEFTKIPLFFLPCTDTPLIHAEIEGRIVCLKVDLGASCDLMLKERILEKVQDKEFQGLSKAFDSAGTSYNDAQYLLPKIKIGNLNIQDAFAGEENLQFLTKGSKLGYWKQKWIDQQLFLIDGRIGCGILSHVHCYFDLPHQALYLAKSLEQIRKCYASDEFIEVPFELQNGLIFLTASTDFGVKRFLLDTGASVSIVRKSTFPGVKNDWIKSKLVLKGFDFGQWEFFLYEITERLQIDGVLGIDFFKKYGVHLDFEHSKAYIQVQH